MTALARIPPDPLPQVHPEPEYRVTGRRSIWYAEMKSALQVPWMGVVTMAYAHYPVFFETLWKGLKPLVVSAPFVEAAHTLRADSERQVDALVPTAIARRLGELGYAPREIDQIRAVIEVFSHGNFPYLLIATLVRLLLEGHEMSGRGEAPRFTARHAPDVDVPLVLMEAHHADPETREVYEDIKATLHLPFVNTDYRAFARWPSYFALAWRDLKPAVLNPAHEAICTEIHDRAVEFAARALPNPGGLTAESLRAAAARDASVEEVLQVACLFQWLLPGLVTNVAFLRAQLSD